MAAETSIDAYRSLRDEGTQKERVLRALRVGPMSDRAIAKRTGLEISEVCGRRNALVKEGRVRAAYEDDGPKGKRVTVWEVVH